MTGGRRQVKRQGDCRQHGEGDKILRYPRGLYRIYDSNQRGWGRFKVMSYFLTVQNFFVPRLFFLSNLGLITQLNKCTHMLARIEVLGYTCLKLKGGGGMRVAWGSDLKKKTKDKTHTILVFQFKELIASDKACIPHCLKIHRGYPERYKWAN